ncbi:Uncharacterised protein [Burkholderia pseudomallei]|uniref:hypothetical protein n=1 Tax=Burkholderia pseudomallei TaxID=28450 RepID=UPI000F1499BA|nr:hypothetical protein [Burkholderia pseudomallei]VBT33911.1 Uncharacterised protein [Burkholderia pseudomallei]
MNDSAKIDRVEFHYNQILECEKLGYEKSRVSTTQGLMVALALADRRFAEPSWQDAPVSTLFARLDPSQVAALKRFRDERGL